MYQAPLYEVDTSTSQRELLTIQELERMHVLARGSAKSAVRTCIHMHSSVLQLKRHLCWHGQMFRGGADESLPCLMARRSFAREVGKKLVWPSTSSPAPSERSWSQCTHGSIMI